jgi:hypothetical protein
MPIVAQGTRRAPALLQAMLVQLWKQNSMPGAALRGSVQDVLPTRKRTKGNENLRGIPFTSGGFGSGLLLSLTEISLPTPRSSCPGPTSKKPRARLPSARLMILWPSNRGWRGDLANSTQIHSLHPKKLRAI